MARAKVVAKTVCEHIPACENGDRWVSLAAGATVCISDLGALAKGHQVLKREIEEPREPKNTLAGRGVVRGDGAGDGHLHQPRGHLMVVNANIVHGLHEGLGVRVPSGTKRHEIIRRIADARIAARGITIEEVN
jgi:hypothetical protein